MAEEKQSGIGSKVGAFVGAVVMLGAGVAGGWIACEMWPKADPAARAAQMAAMMQGGAATVAVRPVEMRAYNLPERYVAHAEAMQEVELLPQVDGYVKEVLFKEGDLVKAGTVLYLLDDERYLAVANQRKADLEAAKADLEAAKAETRRATRYWERMLKADARGITQKERDDAEAGAEKAKAAEARANASIIQAKADLVVAEYDLKKTKIYAPISGQIGKTTAHVGDYVAPSKGALARIVQVDPIRVSFPLTDRAYVAWRAAQKKGADLDVRMRLMLADGSVYGQQGKWDFDDNQMSLETASIMMRLSFPNPDRLLVPNSYVTLLADARKPALQPCVPQQALVDLPGGRQGVYVLKDDMTVEQHPVTTKEVHEGWVPIIEGVKAGDKVVVSGVAKIRHGSKVALAEATANDDLNPAYKPKINE